MLMWSAPGTPRMHKALLASWCLLSKTRSNHYYVLHAVRTHFFWDAIQVRRFLGDQARRLWSQATPKTVSLDWDASRIYSTQPAKFLGWRSAVFWVFRTPALDLFPPLCTDWGEPLDTRQCSTRDKLSSKMSSATIWRSGARLRSQSG